MDRGSGRLSPSLEALRHPLVPRSGDGTRRFGPAALGWMPYPGRSGWGGWWRDLRASWRVTQPVTSRTYPRAMARRADPERVFQARRAAVRYGLMDTGMDEATAERWCDAWVLEATGCGLPRDAAYWQAGADWVAAARAARRPRW